MKTHFYLLTSLGRNSGDLSIGRYCLMGSGNHLNNGLTPSPVCAYLRDLAGWCQNKIVLTNGVFTAKHGNYNTVMRYNTDKTNEYFLVENRTQIALDRYLPSSGLAIYHCALLQADGNLDLECNHNFGDSGDLFREVTGVALSVDTSPSSKQWDRRDSGLTLLDITAPNENIEFKVQ